MHLLVSISLTNDTTTALLQVARTPGAIKVVQGYKPILNIHASAHFEGTSHQDTHLTGAHLCKKFFLPDLSIGIVDEGNLFRWNPPGNQFGTDVIISSKRRC